MKRDISNMSMFEGVQQTLTNDVIDPEYVPTDSDMDRILRDIYSVDENSGLPKGDLVYYLSPDGNPQVKVWLENNLLKPRAAALGTSVDGVTDDLIAEFSKNANESGREYQARLTSIYENTSKEIAEYKSKLSKDE